MYCTTVSYLCAVKGCRFILTASRQVFSVFFYNRSRPGPPDNRTGWWPGLIECEDGVRKINVNIGRAARQFDSHNRMSRSSPIRRDAESFAKIQMIKKGPAKSSRPSV